MTARKPTGYPCHRDEDLAHTAGPCSRRHAPVPVGARPGKGLVPRTTVRLLEDPPNTNTAPPSSPSARRSAPKRATPGKAKRKAGTPYTDADRDRALEAMQRPGADGGIAGAHRATGIPKGTLSRWARDAGLDLGARARQQTRAAADAVAAKATELKLTTVDRLEAILEDQLATLAAIGQLERRAAEAALRPEGGAHIIRVERSALGRSVELEDTTAAGALELARLVAGSVVKRDVVGAATRAIHDLNLLKGEATERGTILVRFGIPRPDATAADASAVDERDLDRPRP